VQDRYTNSLLGLHFNAIRSRGIYCKRSRVFIIKIYLVMDFSPQFYVSCDITQKKKGLKKVFETSNFI